MGHNGCSDCPRPTADTPITPALPALGDWPSQGTLATEPRAAELLGFLLDFQAEYAFFHEPFDFGV